MGLKDETRLSLGSFSGRKPSAQNLVERRLERALALVRELLEPGGDVRLPRDRRTHESIMMLQLCAVNASSSLHPPAMAPLERGVAPTRMSPADLGYARK